MCIFTCNSNETVLHYNCRSEIICISGVAEMLHLYENDWIQRNKFMFLYSCTMSGYGHCKTGSTAHSEKVSSQKIAVVLTPWINYTKIFEKCPFLVRTAKPSYSLMHVLAWNFINLLLFKQKPKMKHSKMSRLIYLVYLYTYKFILTIFVFKKFNPSAREIIQILFNDSPTYYLTGNDVNK